MTINRRQLISNTALAGMALASPFFTRLAQAGDRPPFRISLAQWSLHKGFFDGTLDPVEFAAISARTYGIEAIEYVNQFYADTLDDALVKELRQRADDEGVVSNLIMIDGEGALGAPDEKARQAAIENHYKWADAAHVLGCRSIRVNARSEGSWDEQMKLAADGLHRLAGSNPELYPNQDKDRNLQMAKLLAKKMKTGTSSGTT